MLQLQPCIRRRVFRLGHRTEVSTQRIKPRVHVGLYAAVVHRVLALPSVMKFYQNHTYHHVTVASPRGIRTRFPYLGCTDVIGLIVNRPDDSRQRHLCSRTRANYSFRFGGFMWHMKRSVEISKRIKKSANEHYGVKASIRPVGGD
jgi:hypothetical protein